MEGQLGVSLDKSLQCSSWGSRPLSADQLQYAALDAAVLLMLLDSIIAAALPSRASSGAEGKQGPAVDDTFAHPVSGASKAGADHSALPSRRDVSAIDQPSRHSTADAGSQSAGLAAEGRQNSADGDVAVQVVRGLGGSGAMSASSTSEQTRSWNLQSTEGEACLSTQEQQVAGESETPTAKGRSSTEVSSASDVDRQQSNSESSKAACGAEEASRALDALSLDSTEGSAANGKHDSGSSHGTASQQAASAAQLQEAGQVWGIRLEVGGGCRPKLPKLSRDKRPGVREAFGQDAASTEHIGEIVFQSDCFFKLSRHPTRATLQGCIYSKVIEAQQGRAAWTERGLWPGCCQKWAYRWDSALS